MAQGSGSAAAHKASLYIMAVMLCIIVFISTGAQAAGATTYVVGGPGGWTFNTDSWPNGKRFAAGDILVFKYNPNAHNVVQVDRAGYGRCSAPPRAKVFKSGKDKIKLVKGRNYFICSIAGHCESGMKIAINAV